MEISKLPNLTKYRVFLFPGAVVVLIILSMVMILKPKANDLLGLRKGLSKQKEELAQLSQKVAVLEGYDQSELKTRTNQVLKALPAEKDAPLLLATMRSLTNEYNLELESLNIDVGEVSTESAEPTTKEKPLPSLDLLLSVSGSLNDLYEFLSGVESTSPIIRINQVDITREGDSTEAKIQLSSYYLVIPTDIGKASRQIIPITLEEEKIYQQLSRYKPAVVETALPSVVSGKENPFVF